MGPGESFSGAHDDKSQEMMIGTVRLSIQLFLFLFMRAGSSFNRTLVPIICFLWPLTGPRRPAPKRTAAAAVNGWAHPPTAGISDP